MNILFLPSFSPNGLEDVIYSGLNKLRNINLYEYTLKPSYHPNLLPIEVFNKIFPNGVKPSWLLQHGGGKYIYQRGEYVDLDNFDYIIFGSTRAEVLPLLSRTIKEASDRTLIIDGEDDPFVRLIFKYVKTYFKREKLDKTYSSFSGINRKNTSSAFTSFSKGLKNLPLITPIPQIRSVRERIKSLNMTVIEHQYKNCNDLDIDVSLVASPTNKMRLTYAKALQNIAKRNGLKIYLNNGDMHPIDYQNIILHSKLVVSLPGAGYDTFRYWEVPYYERCLVSYRLPIVIENNFTDFESALFFSSTAEFEKKILWGLKKERYEELRKTAKVRFNQFHTDVKRASRVIN